MRLSKFPISVRVCHRVCVCVTAESYRGSTIKIQWSARSAMRQIRFAFTVQPLFSKKFPCAMELRNGVGERKECLLFREIHFHSGGGFARKEGREDDRILQSLRKGMVIPREVIPAWYKFIRMNILYNPSGVVGIYFAVYTRARCCCARS